MDYYNHPDFYNINHLFEGEIWKDVEGYEGYYQISNCGRAKSLDRVFDHKNKYNFLSQRRQKGRMLKQSFSRKKNGYLVVGFSKENIHDVRTVHSLVAKYFILNPENKPQVNHKTGDKTKNHYTLLEWSTALENTGHAVQSRLRENHIRGEGTYNHKISESQVRKIRLEYKEGSAKALSKKYGVTESNILLIVKRKRWKHVL